MDAQGYLAEAHWDGSVLTLRATTRAARVALLGEDHAAGEVRIPARDIASVDLSMPKLAGTINGNLTIRTAAGKRFQVHFRKKQTDGIAALAAALPSPA